MLVSGTAAPAPSDKAFIIAGLVVELRHDLNLPAYPTLGWGGEKMKGGDENAPSGKGFTWITFKQNSPNVPSDLKLPGGIVFGLKHSTHQKQVNISVHGYDPVKGPSSISGFSKQSGGDDGAPSGQGFYWYETTGEGFSDWSIVEQLPKGTVIGLKHSKNQKNKVLTWKGKSYDATNRNGAVPEGYTRKHGGDRGLRAGEGYSWFEKITCPCSKAEGEDQ